MTTSAKARCPHCRRLLLEIMSVPHPVHGLSGDCRCFWDDARQAYFARFISAADRPFAKEYKVRCPHCDQHFQLPLRLERSEIGPSRAFPKGAYDLNLFFYKDEAEKMASLL